MEKIDEKSMLDMLSKARRVALVESSRGQYVPIGLAKIAAFVRRNGGTAEFVPPSGVGRAFDLAAVSTLFTYDADAYRKAIRAIGAASDGGTPVLVGGVCTSLSPGLLDQGEEASMFQPPAFAFQGFSRELDLCVPDYSVDWGQRDGWERYSYAFTSRGCPNHCGYCAVPRLERTAGLQGAVGGILVNPNWREHIVPDRRTCVILDNNITAAPPRHPRPSLRQRRNIPQRPHVLPQGAGRRKPAPPKPRKARGLARLPARP